MTAPSVEGYEDEAPTSLASSPTPSPASAPTNTASAPRPPSPPSAPPPSPTEQTEMEEPVQFSESTTSHTEPTDTSPSSTEASDTSEEETTTTPPLEEIPEDLLPVLTEGAETEGAAPGKWVFQKGEKGEKIQQEAADESEDEEVPLFSTGLPQGAWEAQEHKDESDKKIEEEASQTVEEEGVPLDLQLSLVQPSEAVAPTAPLPRRTPSSLPM